MSEDKPRGKEFLFHQGIKDERYFYMHEMAKKMKHIKKIWMVRLSSDLKVSLFGISFIVLRFEIVMRIIQTILHAAAIKGCFISCMVRNYLFRSVSIPKNIILYSEWHLR